MFDELDEEEAPGMSIEDMAKAVKNYQVSKGFARTSFFLASKRYNDNLKLPEDKRAKPKKVLNRIHYQYLEAVDKCKDPVIMLAALNFIHDRLDGRAQQAIVPQNPDGSPLTVQILKLTDAGSNPTE